VSKEILDQRATLRVEPTSYCDEPHRLFTLNCRHGETTAETNNADDAVVLAYAVAYHTAQEGCQCGERLFLRLRP
jgi:hypothetical protein